MNRLVRGGGLLALLFAASCGEGPGEDAAPPAATETAPAGQLYTRTFVFLGRRDGAPLVVPFSFTAVRGPEGTLRTARGWLAHGPTWDRFLDQSWQSWGQGTHWRVLPTEELRVFVGGPAELESLLFERGERTLRLDITGVAAAWTPVGPLRVRLLQGRLNLAGERVTGPVLEVQRIGSADAAGLPFEWLFLTGEGVEPLVAARSGGEAGWARLGEEERSGEQLTLEWTELRPLEEARRDIPTAWRLGVPRERVTGRVTASGFDAVLGEERRGRRAAEVFYTVEGEFTTGGDTREVYGVAHHAQN
ncbi:MAG: hypothetical protein ACREKN_01215 [Longimicrobiaceae bacterium]